ncbi:hypothetical protein EVAR_26839_1 [Eumeta japonica]|uniref:Uncharacterized protein n=1 Tax=Eumeta variegata TaxID=151549 RepID=A0A4C1VZ01_EUMVA|nr:hypothetical protein EVAR_26839_1 [Eumeta japonica]
MPIISITLVHLAQSCNGTYLSIRKVDSKRYTGPQSACNISHSLGHSLVSLYHELHSTDAVFSHRLKMMTLAQIVGQISATTFERPRVSSQSRKNVHHVVFYDDSSKNTFGRFFRGARAISPVSLSSHLPRPEPNGRADEAASEALVQRCLEKR